MDWTLMAFIGICAVAASSGALFPPGRWYESIAQAFLAPAQLAVRPGLDGACTP
jgi:hypothetical protein